MKSLFALLLLAFAMAGCAGDSMVGSDDSTDVAGKAPKLVPIEGAMTFTGIPGPPIDCGYGQLFLAEYSGEADFDHLGHSGVAIAADQCGVNLTNGTLEVWGTTTLTAANGDVVNAPWFMVVTRDPSGGPVGTYTVDIDFAGGTGRFDGAGGWMDGQGTFDQSTQQGGASFVGMISSVGSLKQK